ncbi:MAG: Omp28-related outer membrane protein, partial [Chitinophagaceae bacterium]
LPISGNQHVFTTEGTFAVYALKNAISTTVLVVTVSKPSTNMPPVSNSDKFVHHVLVEEFSGTWCGNCPQILYGVDLLKLANNKVIFVGVHLFGDDPFITTDGNALANARQVSGVPTGHINRGLNWVTPQYNNLTQVTNSIQNSSDIGIAIQSSLVNTSIQAIVKVRTNQQTLSNAKLHCFLVEDNLKHTQRNYFPNLYGGAGSISNFTYNDVFRKSLTGTQGTVISLQQNEFSANLSTNIASNFNTSNLKLVAFVTDNSGKVLNAFVATVGQNKNFERL